MNIKNIINKTKEKRGYDAWTKMARDMDISVDTLKKLATENVEIVNVDVLKKVAKFLDMRVDDLLNVNSCEESLEKDTNVFYTKDCEDLNIILDELIQKANQKGATLRFDNIDLNEDSRQILIDSISVVKQLVRSKLG